MNRIDRLTAILTHLQSKRLIRAVELAERFNVSLRTIYRDVRALEESGIPIIGEAGQGYSLMEGYRLPPVMFTKEEALSFLVAEKLVEKALDEQSSQFFKEALIKIKSVLKSDEKDLLVDLQDSIKVMKSTVLNNANKSFQTVLRAISERKVIETAYKTFVDDRYSERKLEPLGMFHTHEQWYLIAFCLLRNDYRTFRLDRFSSLRITDQFYTRSKHPSLQNYLDRIADEQKLHQIVVSVPKKSVKYLANAKYSQGFVSEVEQGDHLEMTFMNSSIEGFVRWIITLGDMVQVKKPVELQNRLDQLLDDIRKNQAFGISRKGDCEIF